MKRENYTTIECVDLKNKLVKVWMDSVLKVKFVDYRPTSSPNNGIPQDF